MHVTCNTFPVVTYCMHVTCMSRTCMLLKPGELRACYMHVLINMHATGVTWVFLLFQGTA